MNTLKALAAAAVSTLLGLGFFALIAWEWQLGLAAGSYGGTTFAEAPGLAWFILAMQAAMGVMSLMSAVARLRGSNAGEAQSAQDGAPAGLFDAVHALIAAGAACAVVALGLWAAWDLVAMALGLFRQGTEELGFRIIISGLLCAGIGVFVMLLWTMLAQPLFEYWGPRVRAALAYFRARG